MMWKNGGVVNMPVIDSEKCNGCGLCIDVCQCQILVMVDNKVEIVLHERCNDCRVWCTQCELVCPTGALICPFNVTVEKSIVDNS